MDRLGLRNNWLCSRNNLLKIKTSGKLAITLEEYVEYTPKVIKKILTITTCNRSDLEHYEFEQLYPKISQDTNY